MKIKEIPICSSPNQAPQQFTAINLSQMSTSSMLMFPIQSSPTTNTTIKPTTIISPAQNFGSTPFYIFTSQPTFNTTNISPLKVPLATYTTIPVSPPTNASPVQLGQLPINKILDTNYGNVNLCNRTIRDVLSSQKSPSPLCAGKTSNSNCAPVGQPEVKKRRVLFKKPEVPSEKPKEVFVINSVATKCLKDQNKPVNVENIKEKLDKESIKVLINDMIQRIENELEPKPTMNSTVSRINLTVKPAAKKSTPTAQILPKMSTSALEKTIFDSIDSTLANASAQDIENELKASSTPKKAQEQFRAGQRKRVIQHVDNSFVVMNRKDTKLSEKRSKSMPDLSSLTNKQVDEAQPKDEENGTSLESCPLCMKTFQNEQKLKRHLSETHNEKARFLKKNKNETGLKDPFITHLNVTYILTLKGQEKIDLVKKFDDPFYDNLLQSETETSEKTEESEKALSTSFDSFTMLVKQSKPRKSANTSLDCTPEMNKREKSFQRRTSHLAKKLAFEEKPEENCKKPIRSSTRKKSSK